MKEINAKGRVCDAQRRRVEVYDRQVTLLGHDSHAGMPATCKRIEDEQLADGRDEERLAEDRVERPAQGRLRKSRKFIQPRSTLIQVLPEGDSRRVENCELSFLASCDQVLLASRRVGNVLDTSDFSVE